MIFLQFHASLSHQALLLVGHTVLLWFGEVQGQNVRKTTALIGIGKNALARFINLTCELHAHVRIFITGRAKAIRKEQLGCCELERGQCLRQRRLG